VQPLLTTTADTVQTDLIFDKFRHSNRLLVKIQDGCHRFCNYCIVPYLRGTPQSQTIAEIVSYINSFDPLPSEVVLSAINTEAFGKDTGESLVTLVKEVLQKTKVPRIGFGSVHPWSINAAFLEYYKKTLSKEKRFIHFFHVPIQSGSQPMLDAMRREYAITDVIRSLEAIKKIRPDAFIATDVIVGYLGETDDLFAETYTTLQKSPISRFHVFPFSNRAHTAAFYMKKRIAEVSAADKKKRATALRTLSNQKYTQFVETLMGKEYDALVVERTKRGTRLLLDNNVEYVTPKDALPGDIIHVKMESSLDASLRS
jgi:threonylcarbamoyladenosine tRNA methylthiotransferase MtaB